MRGPKSKALLTWEEQEYERTMQAIGLIITGFILLLYGVLALVGYTFTHAKYPEEHEERRLRGLRDVNRTWIVSLAIGIPLLIATWILDRPFREQAIEFLRVWGKVVVACVVALPLIVVGIHKSVDYAVYLYP
jgi:magnesium-transporting ATPase (P-type)